MSERPAVKEGDSWDCLAASWDERHRDGGLVERQLLFPAIESLLALRPGQRALDVACGSGSLARRLASGGVRVTAVDSSARMIEVARRRTPAGATVDYRVADVTDPAQLAALGARYAAIVVCMALTNIPDHRPLAAAARMLTSPSGRLVFAVNHPCFNSPHRPPPRPIAAGAGLPVSRYELSLFGYRTPRTYRVALPVLAVPYQYSHRPLAELLRPFLDAGLVIDALRELPWSGTHDQDQEFPAYLLCRCVREPSRGRGRMPSG